MVHVAAEKWQKKKMKINLRASIAAIIRHTKAIAHSHTKMEHPMSDRRQNYCSCSGAIINESVDAAGVCVCVATIAKYALNVLHALHAANGVGNS